MKIIEITKDENVYTVKQAPGFIGRMLNRKERTTKLKQDKWRKYMFGGNIYYKENGEQLDNWDSIGIAIDNWERRF